MPARAPQAVATGGFVACGLRLPGDHGVGACLRDDGVTMTKDFQDRGLIINERLEDYDGTTAVVRTEHLSAEEVEFLRWRAERWMKLRHMPVAFAHDPLFVLRSAPKMFAHTFRGSTLKSWLGLEDEHKAFERFRAIHKAERAYI